MTYNNVVIENMFSGNSVAQYRERRAALARGVFKSYLRRALAALKRYAVILSLSLFFLWSLFLCWIAAGMMIASHSGDLILYHSH